MPHMQLTHSAGTYEQASSPVRARTFMHKTVSLLCETAARELSDARDDDHTTNKKACKGSNGHYWCLELLLV